jgi:hypothetical protein
MVRAGTWEVRGDETSSGGAAGGADGDARSLRRLWGIGKPEHREHVVERRRKLGRRVVERQLIGRQLVQRGFVE